MPDLIPMPGDCVIHLNGECGITPGSIGILDGHVGTPKTTEPYYCCFNWTIPFRGPASKYETENGEYVSTSGGPVPFIFAEELIPSGITRVQTFWRWQDLPRADGGDYYSLTVPVWYWPNDDEKRKVLFANWKREIDEEEKDRQLAIRLRGLQETTTRRLVYPYTPQLKNVSRK